MSDDCRRYGRLMDHLYKFIAGVASCTSPDWGEREDIEMAIRFIKRLEALHEKEEWEEQQAEKAMRDRRRQERLKKKRAGVVKLVTNDSGKDAS